MTKIEEKRKAAMEEARQLLKDMKQDEANAYVSENFTKTDIKKAFMAAYIEKFSKKEDRKWFEEDFKKAATKTVKKMVSTVCTDANGIVIHKEGKDGKAIPKTARVPAIGGETYEKFDINGAREAFLEHFGITPKASKFVPKAKRTEKVYDEFDGLFQ